MLQFLKYVSQQGKCYKKMYETFWMYGYNNALNHYLFDVTMQQGTEHFFEPHPRGVIVNL